MLFLSMVNASYVVFDKYMKDHILYSGGFFCNQDIYRMQSNRLRASTSHWEATFVVDARGRVLPSHDCFSQAPLLKLLNLKNNCLLLLLLLYYYYFFFHFLRCYGGCKCYCISSVFNFSSGVFPSIPKKSILLFIKMDDVMTLFVKNHTRLYFFLPLAMC